MSAMCLYEPLSGKGRVEILFLGLVIKSEQISTQDFRMNDYNVEYIYLHF